MTSLVARRPAAMNLLSLWHLPQLTYYTLWLGWGSVELLIATATAAGLVACRWWRLQVRGAAGAR